MPAKTTDVLDTRTECAIVLELLNRSSAISVSALYRAIESQSSPMIETAVQSLAEVGLLVVEDDRVSATAALQRIDALGMISV
jgi:hypothetical protein